MNALRLALLTVAVALPAASVAAQGPPPAPAGVTTASAATTTAAPAAPAAAAAAKTPEAMFGMTLTISGNERDTLGMLAGVITAGGAPASAGVVESRLIAEV